MTNSSPRTFWNSTCTRSSELTPRSPSRPPTRCPTKRRKKNPLSEVIYSLDSVPSSYSAKHWFSFRPLGARRAREGGCARQRHEGAAGCAQGLSRYCRRLGGEGRVGE